MQGFHAAKNRLGKGWNAVQGALTETSFRASNDPKRSMKIAIVKERRPHETRVAATPETVKKLKALGAEVTIEAGAGIAAAYTDQAYGDAGATIVPDAASAVAAGDILFKVARPMSAAEGVDELAMLRQGQVLMAPLGALSNKEIVQALASKGVTAFALELIPRITRAQSMDILSSQANLAGYKAVLTIACTVAAVPGGMSATVGVGLSMCPTILQRSSNDASVALVKWKPVRISGRSDIVQP